MVANPIAFPSVTTSYIVTAIGSNPLCEDVDTVVINVVPNLDGIAGVDTAVCPGKPIQLWGEGGDFYDWEPSTYLDNSKSSVPICVPMVTTTYTVVISNVFDCTDTVVVHVEVYPDPIVTVNQPYDIFLGETAQLFAHGGVGSSYSWEPDDDLDNSTIYNPVASPDSTTLYYVVITTAEGCTFYDSTRVNVSEETFITMPNAFTPNGDGVNDELKIIMRGPATLNAYKIFDRWGTNIFFTNNINEGWKGTNRGKPCEVGTYVYVIEGNDGNGQHFNKHGYFILLR
jgi:gliding motility-associated-like protein